MPYGIFQAGPDYRLYKTTLAGEAVGDPIAHRDQLDRARRLLSVIEDAKTASFEIPREIVAQVCSDCGAKMDERGLDTLQVIEGKAAAGDLLQGLCEVMAPVGSEPWEVTAYMAGQLDPDTYDMFEMWIYHTCQGMKSAGALPLTVTKKGLTIERKAIPQFQFKAQEGDDQRVKTQVFAVFGHVDSVGDRINLGAFTKTIQENSQRIQVLWQHDFDAPPIGVVVEIGEKRIEELPPEAAEFYRTRFPDATGVLLAKVRYSDTPRGNEILTLINDGALKENSIGFSTVRGKSGYTVEDGVRIRELFEVYLWDISPVNWGANDATTNLKRVGDLHYGEDDLAGQVDALNALITDFKEGRVLSDANLKRLKTALEALQEVIATAEPLDEDKAAQDPTLTDQRDSILQRLRLAEAELYLRS